MLDAARATLRVSSIVEPSRAGRLPLALMGYSGGALASGWALQQQKEYAPELSSNLVAAALGGLPVNVEDILLKLNGGPMAGRESNSLVESGHLSLTPHCRSRRLRPRRT